MNGNNGEYGRPITYRVGGTPQANKVPEPTPIRVEQPIQSQQSIETLEEPGIYGGFVSILEIRSRVNK